MDVVLCDHDRRRYSGDCWKRRFVYVVWRYVVITHDVCLHGSKPVSYTHLDVYKRQVVDDRVRRENLVNQILGYKVRRLLSFFLSSPFFRMDNG